MGLGEPLFYSKLLSSIEDVKKISPKIKVVIATNGITLSKTVSKKLIQAGVDEISISLNSENEKKYFLNMGVKAFSVVKKNIKDLIEIRNKIEGSKSLIFVQYLDFERNRNKFLKEIHCWKKIMRTNDKCYIHSIVNQGGMVDTIDKDKRINYPCAQPNFRVAIKIDGSLYPCDVCFYSGNKKIDSLYLGNILKNGIYNDFMDKNSKRWKIIKLMRDYNYKKLPICEKCTTSKLSSNSYFKIPKFLKFKKVWL
jgi:radical SAM protein with 4Fe4S-binding SPASM domain